ncbi:MAG: methylmalonyl-CoA epimerase [Deltaproteobacteria bacterium]|nr:methylmalonyl-CoA epimerase [Deltaproteobacteria bacterium]
MMYPVDHIGIAVADLDSAVKPYQSEFGYSLDLREEVPSQKVEVAFLKAPNMLIEFIAATSPDSAVSKFLEKRGPGLHHICYRVTDIRAELGRFASLGYTLIDKEPRPGAHGSLIAFIHPREMQGVLTELCQREL